MKIGFFSDTYLPTVHGVNVSIESFRKELEKMGHEVYIFTPFIPEYKDNNPRIFRLRSLPFFKNPEIRMGLPSVRNNSLKKIINIKFDVVHAQTPFNLGWMAKYISKKQKIPLVYTHHTRLAEGAASYLKSKRILPKLAQSIYVWSANMSDAVIAPSDEIKNLLKREGVKKPIYTLPTGVNLENFKSTEETRPQSAELRKELQIDPDDKVLIFVGRMDPDKNIDFLIRSFEKICSQTEKIKLLLVGSGFYEDILKKLAKKLKLSQVIFAGSVPYERIHLYYQAADIFVFASPTETQGLVILEAMASGLPIVAVKNGVIDNLVENKKNGYLLEFPDENNFAEKIIGILNNPKIQEKYSQNSLEMAGNFSSKKQTNYLLEIYNQLISEKNAHKL